MNNKKILDQELDTLSEKDLSELLAEKEKVNSLIKCSDYINNQLKSYGLSLWIKNSKKLESSMDKNIDKQNKIFDLIFSSLDFKKPKSIKNKRENKTLLERKIVLWKNIEENNFKKIFRNTITLIFFIILLLIHVIRSLSGKSYPLLSIVIVGGIISHFISVKKEKNKRLILENFVLKILNKRDKK